MYIPRPLFLFMSFYDAVFVFIFLVENITFSLSGIHILLLLETALSETDGKKCCPALEITTSAGNSLLSFKRADVALFLFRSWEIFSVMMSG